jgi:hypothetical protein
MLQTYTTKVDAKIKDIQGSGGKIALVKRNTSIA